MKNKTIAAVAKKAGGRLNVINEAHVSKWLLRAVPCHDMLVSVKLTSNPDSVVYGVDGCDAWALYMDLSGDTNMPDDSNLSVAGILSDARRTGAENVNLPFEVVLREMVLSGVIDKSDYLVLFDPTDFDAKVDSSNKFYESTPVLSLGSELVVVDDCFKMISGTDELLFGYNKNGLYLAA